SRGAARRSTTWRWRFDGPTEPPGSGAAPPDGPPPGDAGPARGAPRALSPPPRGRARQRGRRRALPFARLRREHPRDLGAALARLRHAVQRDELRRRPAGGRGGDRGRGFRRFRARPATGTPCVAGTGNGLLPFQQRRDRRTERAGRVPDRARGDRRLRRPPGNGTEAIFAGDDSVLYVSLHEWPFYPGTGGPDDQAETTVNIPLAAGSGDDEYLQAFEQLVEPAVAGFDPGLVLVSAGFDAHVDDPLAEMEVTADGFRELSRRCAALAPRVAAVLEGGYQLETLPGLVAAALEGFGA